MNKQKISRIVWTTIGLVLIALAFTWPARKFLSNNKEKVNEIDLSKFQGKYHLSINLEIQPTITEHSSKKYLNLEDFSKDCILTFDPPRNYINIIVPDNINSNDPPYYKVKILHKYIGGNDESKLYTSAIIDDKIIVYEEPIIFVYFWWTIAFLFLIIVGMIILLVNW